jgi:hypothetical protein
MTAAEAIEHARDCDILEVAERFTTLKKIAANERAGPCPGCGGADRLGVNSRKQVFNCRGCGAKGDVIGLVRLALGVSFAEAVEYLAGPSAAPRERIKPRAPATDEEDARKQHAKARWLWGKREPLAGSIGETYLRKARAYNGPLPPTLGFLPAFKDYPPALICAFALHPGEIEPGVLAEPRDVQSVQLIALKPDGSGKADVEAPKRSIGGHKGLPIVVSPVNDGLGLSIHEGVEDALSAYEATGLGCWASGGATFLAALADAVPSYVECVTIGEHKDNSG